MLERKSIVLGNQHYLIERITSDNATYRKEIEYVRKFEYADMMCFDQDIIFRTKGSDVNIWPYVPNNIKGHNVSHIFSTDVKKFDINFQDNWLPVMSSSSKSPEKIMHDIYRIYHPHTKVHIPCLIYVNCYIKGVNFHLYIDSTENLVSKSVTEIEIDGNRYSEYYEIEVPNIESLLHDGYYEDPLSIIEDMDNTHLPFSLYKRSFMIEKDKDGQFYKSYIPLRKDYNDLSKFVSSVSLSLIPYSGIDSSTQEYVADETYPENSAFFYNEVRFTMESSLKFIDGELTLCNEFSYPGNFSSFQKSYEWYNDVKLSDYEGIVLEEDDEDIDYEEDSIIDGELQMCGFRLSIATDIEFKNIIYKSTHWTNEPDDFNFGLCGIFSDWKQLPDVLVCKAAFIDRYIGNVFIGNTVMITKENYKYMIHQSDTNRHRIEMIDGLVQD